MQTTDSITFDPSLYNRATHWTFLLYEQNGVSLVIPLPNANVMSFIRPFNNTVQCQQFAEANLQKMITLFVWDDNMKDWLNRVTNIPVSLHEIKIFCNSNDQPFLDAWLQRYINRYTTVTFEIIPYEELNYSLMIFGIAHLKKLHADFQQNSPLYPQLNRNYKRICRALANYFWNEANTE
ncbi:unnamed protein product [Adineta ricciae]|uniref:Uncharacterized protein n=1 Tax=Adineta ricciae TaxID=249248 RepID=A0A813UUV2_ADIRI|nr:unnamed protein product [Adineta ricciae]CAF1447297.1 unnamed protein product [Adineta ricciae]